MGHFVAKAAISGTPTVHVWAKSAGLVAATSRNSRISCSIRRAFEVNAVAKPADGAVLVCGDVVLPTLLRIHAAAGDDARGKSTTGAPGANVDVDWQRCSAPPSSRPPAPHTGNNVKMSTPSTNQIAA